MKKVFLVLLLVAMMLPAGCSFWGRKSQVVLPRMIKIFEPQGQDNFTNEQLKTFMKQNDAPSVLVRSFSTTGGDVASNANVSAIVSILEAGLARNGLDVRDRSIFNIIMQSGAGVVDYQKLYEKTQVDLIFEISNYSLNDEYLVDSYWEGDIQRSLPGEPIMVGKKKIPQKASYVLRGMSIQVKVIILKDNLVGGTYSYSYVPCAAELGGGEITNLLPLRYIPPTGGGAVDATANGGHTSSLMMTRSERLNQEMSNFLTNEAIPKIIAGMKGESFVSQSDRLQRLARNKAELDKITDAEELLATLDAQSQNLAAEAAGAQNPTSPAQGQPSASDQGQVTFASNVAPAPLKVVNSLEKLAPATASLIDGKYMREVPAKKSSAKNDLQKLTRLGMPSKIEIGKFVITSAGVTGNNLAGGNDGVIMFWVGPTRIDNDSALLLFVDGKCMGVGTMGKGLYTEFPQNQVLAGIHEVRITDYAGHPLFGSEVDFSIRDKFNFVQPRIGVLTLN